MNINLTCPINHTGYGITSWNIYKQLIIDGHEVALWPHSLPANPDQTRNTLLNIGIQNAKKFSYKSPCLNIWHPHDLIKTYGRGLSSALTFFELDTFNHVEKHSLNYPDILFVASNWAKEIVSEVRRTGKIVVSPLGVDTTEYIGETYEDNDGPYIFLNVGKWEVRKGHDILIDVFDKTFKKDDNVELWIVPNSSQVTNAERLKWEHKYANSKMGRCGKVKILGWQDDLIKTMKSAHCGVFPARAEGWNLELLEMMALGKPVITTDYSAHTEFCNGQNAMLIPYREKEIAVDHKYFWPKAKGNWMKFAQKEMKYLADYMRACYNERRINNPEGIKTGQKFSWANTTNQITKALSE